MIICVFNEEYKDVTLGARGCASFLGNDRSLTRTKGSIKNDPIVPEKERAHRVRS